ASPGAGRGAALQFLSTKRELLNVCHIQSCKDVKAVQHTAPISRSPTPPKTYI
ncbi:hypothetical protein M9458_029333, partial [Cirrhinus mrigala]